VNRRPWLLFVVLVWLQVLVFHRIHWLGIFNPMVYTIPLIWMPLGWNRALQLLVGFGMGWWIDGSVQSGAVHAMASTLVVYLKHFWIRWTVSPVILQDEPDPDLREIEFRSLLTYAGGLILIHHATLYALDALRLDIFGTALLKAGLNSILVFGILWSLLQWTSMSRPAR
jgi:hypothetical protein